MKKTNLKEVINIIKQNVQNEEVEIDIIDLPNNKIKHIIIGNKKIIKSKKQSSMTTKQFQEFVIEFIKEQKEVNKRQEQTNMKQAEFNQFVIEFIKEQKLVNQRQEETNKKQEIFNQQQLEFNKKQEKFNEIILNEIKEIKIRLDKIESCPTIQKELNQK